MEEMKPGRDIDALVAEKVMGWKQTKDPYDNGLAWSNPSGGIWSELPDYSTDIAAAWSVVERLSKDGWFFRIEVDGDGELNSVTLFRNERDGSAQLTAESAPHAICLAALRAVGVEVRP